MKYRCLSMWQPWATLAASGVKKFETRGRDTKIRGTVLIHAAQTRKGMSLIQSSGAIEKYWFKQCLPTDVDGGTPKEVILWDELPTGAIIGAVNITETYRSEHLRDFFQQSKRDGPLDFCATGISGQLLKHLPTLTEMRQAEAFGDYGPDRWAWKLEDCLLFKEPIPAKGSQGFFFVDMDIPEMKDFPFRPLGW